MDLEALTSRHLRRAIERGITTAVVPFGSIEHQGAHLPIGADSLLADAVGREVAQRLGAVLVPTLRVGCADAHVELSGTLSLQAGTLTAVAFELAETIATQGFTRIVLLSTHGGNHVPINAAVDRFNRDRSDDAIAVAPRGDVGPDPGRHSGQWLTSVMLALWPELVDVDAAEPDLAEELRAASADRGKMLLERFTASIVEALR